MACGSIGAQRYIVEECLKLVGQYITLDSSLLIPFQRWATQRQVFGKPLSSQAVIRAKLAEMISRVESAQSWIENITYQMNYMNYKQQAIHLAGYATDLTAENDVNPNASSSAIALAKKYCTETAQETAKDAVQVWFSLRILRQI